MAKKDFFEELLNSFGPQIFDHLRDELTSINKNAKENDIHDSDVKTRCTYNSEEWRNGELVNSSEKEWVNGDLTKSSGFTKQPECCCDTKNRELVGTATAKCTRNKCERDIEDRYVEKLRFIELEVEDLRVQLENAFRENDRLNEKNQQLKKEILKYQEMLKAVKNIVY